MNESAELLEPSPEQFEPAEQQPPRSRLWRYLWRLGVLLLVVALAMLVFRLRPNIFNSATIEPITPEHDAHAHSSGAPITDSFQTQIQNIAGGKSAATTWTCSMHPQIHRSAPGKCPICGMNLIPITSDSQVIDSDKRRARNTTSEKKVWTCAMYPKIRRSAPGKCPGGMDMIPLVSKQTPGFTSVDRVTLSEHARILAKLRTTAVTSRKNIAVKLRLLGRVEANETTLKTVTAWIGGRIERLHVNVTGQKIRAGQVIATLYSPEIFNVHQDMLVAQRQIKRVKRGSRSSRADARASLRAVRERLRLLGIPDRQIARMETQTKPTRLVPIRTPFTGTVIERMGSEGAYITTGTPLYRVANLRTLWVQLDAYEVDLPLLALKQPVRLEMRAFPGEIFKGKITFIDPTVDAVRRTIRVRVKVKNRDGRLRPGMFATATITAKIRARNRRRLVVPATAPLFTGQRALVYVETETHQDGRITYEPRTIRLGSRLGNMYEVVSGLAKGERVVTRGAFALDADLQIRGGASMMSADEQDSTSTPRSSKARRQQGHVH